MGLYNDLGMHSAFQADVTRESIQITLKVADIYERVDNGELAKWRLEKLEGEA